jgi:hypothetical protein
MKIKLSSIIKLLNNDMTNFSGYTNNPSIKITLLSDTILLDTLERKMFGSFSHEYIIERNIIFTENFINKSSNILPKKMTGLIKDIYLVSQPINHQKLTYIPKVTNNYDIRYNRYLTATQYYNEYIIKGYFTTIIEAEYYPDIELLKIINQDISDYTTSINKENTKVQLLINEFSGYSYYNKYDYTYDFIKFLLFLIYKFFGNTNSIITSKYYVLHMYLQKLFSNKQIVEQISPLDTMTIKITSSELFARRDWSYFTNAIPYQKFNNSLPIGYYVHTFSLYPTDSQYSGHLNFTHFDDVVFDITSNELVVNNNEPYFIKTILKEYNILRIMSGLASLGWIN